MGIHYRMGGLGDSVQVWGLQTGELIWAELLAGSSADWMLLISCHLFPSTAPGKLDFTNQQAMEES